MPPVTPWYAQGTHARWSVVKTLLIEVFVLEMRFAGRRDLSVGPLGEQNDVIDSEKRLRIRYISFQSTERGPYGTYRCPL